MKPVEIHFGMDIQYDQQAAEKSDGKSAYIEDGKRLVAPDKSDRSEQVPERHHPDY
jgi:hypothetical protein